jgi:shikimate dehydrogenase
VDAVYIPFEVADVDEFARRMVRPGSREFEWNLRGFSVTAPHKTAIMRHLDWAEPSAREIGAVNTVVVEGTELHGYNTDAAASLVPLLARCALRGARVAVLGAGGAARALLWSLREQGAQATVYARDAVRARATAESFGARLLPLDGARFEGFDAVVNTTTLGTRGVGEQATPATAGQLSGARVAYDLVYNPAETRFMREAREAGCDSVGGLPMLVAQAAAQFKLWTGEDAPLDVMRAAAEVVGGRWPVAGENKQPSPAPDD